MGGASGKHLQHDKEKYAKAVLDAVNHFESEENNFNYTNLMEEDKKNITNSNNNNSNNGSNQSDLFKRRMLQAASNAANHNMRHEIAESLEKLTDADIESLHHRYAELKKNESMKDIHHHRNDATTIAATIATATTVDSKGGISMLGKKIDTDDIVVDNVEEFNNISNDHNNFNNTTISSTIIINNNNNNNNSNSNTSTTDANSNNDNIDETTSVLSYGDDNDDDNMEPDDGLDASSDKDITADMSHHHLSRSELIMNLDTSLTETILRKQSYKVFPLLITTSTTTSDHNNDGDGDEDEDVGTKPRGPSYDHHQHGIDDDNDDGTGSHSRSNDSLVFTQDTHSMTLPRKTFTTIADTVNKLIWDSDDMVSGSLNTPSVDGGCNSPLLRKSVNNDTRGYGSSSYYHNNSYYYSSPISGNNNYHDRGSAIDHHNDTIMGLQHKKVIALTQNAELERQVEALKKQLEKMEQLDKAFDTKMNEEKGDGDRRRGGADEGRTTMMMMMQSSQKHTSGRGVIMNM